VFGFSTECCEEVITLNHETKWANQIPWRICRTETRIWI